MKNNFDYFQSQDGLLVKSEHVYFFMEVHGGRKSHYTRIFIS